MHVCGEHLKHVHRPRSSKYDMFITTIPRLGHLTAQSYILTVQVD